MANWEVKRVGLADLEATLEKAPAGWKVFTVIPAGDGVNFVVIYQKV